MPAGLHVPSRDALTLPDVLTESDNLEMPPLPDATFLLSQMDDDVNTPRRKRAGSRDINLADDFGASQYLQSSIVEKGYGDEDLALDDDLDLGLNLGLDGGDSVNVEFGRDAAPARDLEDDIGDTELNIFGKDGQNGRRDSVQVSVMNDDGGFQFQDDDGDFNMGGADQFAVGDQPDGPLGAPTPLGRARISESPLSDLDPNFQREMDEDHQLLEPADETEQTIMRAPHRARKLKLIEADMETTLSTALIKAQQRDTSQITRPQSFLPRDAKLFALMEMQRNGGFVSNIMGDGRSAGWAPELRGMLSLDAISKSRDLKRKRDSGIADMDDEEGHAHKSPRLALDFGDEDEGSAFPANDAGFDATTGEKSIHELPEDGFHQIDDDEGFGAIEDRPVSRDSSNADQPNFDTTSAPLIHPADNGPVSLGTKHAVPLLRDLFGSEAANSPQKRKNASVLFADLLPEATTSKADATKMFFEILVLATKDAVKVEQKEGVVGGPIRVRGKRGLWGSWAEKEAGGEIAEEIEEETAAAQIAVAA
jgi:cohesin complex subunit SCC1